MPRYVGGMRTTAFDNREQVSVLDWARVNKAWPPAVPSNRRSMVLDLPRLWVLDAIHGWVQIKSLNGGEALSTGGGSTPIASQSWTDPLDAQESASSRQTPIPPSRWTACHPNIPWLTALRTVGMSPSRIVSMPIQANFLSIDEQAPDEIILTTSGAA